MTDAKHTPEKWTYTIERVGLGNTKIIKADGTHIATTWFPPGEDDSVYPVSIIKAVGWMLEAANACRGMADPAAEIAELRKKAQGMELLIQTVQAMADTTTEGQPTTEALLDKVKENMALRAEVERLRRYVGDEMIRSDFKTAAQMRSQLEHCRNEATALRRNEAEAIDAIKAVGYTTPHGESDSLGEAVAWLVAENSQLRKAEEEADSNHSRTMDERDHFEAAFTEAYCRVTGRVPEWSNHFSTQDAIQQMAAVVAAGDRLADAVEAQSSRLSSETNLAVSLLYIVDLYRKERAS